MLRRFIFISEIKDAIAHTFNSVLGYDKNLSKDKIGNATRVIQRGRAYNFDGVNDFISAPHITTQTIISYEGTSTLSISAGEIQGTAGYAHSILLSDGTLYKCDEGAGTTAYDSSGNGNHGTLMNGLSHITLTNGEGADYQNQVGYTNNLGVLIPRNEAIPTEDVLGNPLQHSGRVKYDAQVWGRYFSFNGTNHIGVYMLSPAIPISDFCLSCRFRSRKTDNTSDFIQTFYRTGNTYISIIINNVGNLRFVVNYLGSFVSFVYTGIDFRDQVWRDISVVGKDGGLNYEIRIDGVLVGTATDGVSRTILCTALRFGSFGGMHYVKGDIYNARFYNISKTPAEVEHIRQGGVDNVGLVAYYRCDEGLGATAYDSSGNVRNASLFNGVVHGTQQGQGSIARQKLGHSLVGGASAPRNEAIPTQDVLGNPLEYVGDNQSLLPGGRVNFDTAPAPELINANTPQDYNHGDVLPTNITKVIDTYKEKDFIIKKI